MTGTQDQALPTKYSWRKCSACHEPYQAYVAMKYCPKCRVERMRRGSISDHERREAYHDHQLQRKKHDSAWHEIVGDWRVVDEHGVEVWASDLAERYRSELRRRRTGDYRTRQSRSFSR